MRLLILGNAGSGKTTYARRRIATTGAALLPLDAIAWNPGPARKPLAESRAALDAFLAEHPHWAIEGCYADLAALVAPHADELVFLNPGVEACVAQCLARPHESDKFASAAEQQAMLDVLLDFVRDYPTRDDAYGLAAHRRVYEAFAGTKREFTDPRDYAPDADSRAPAPAPDPRDNAPDPNPM